jgi:hypothetical protein
MRLAFLSIPIHNNPYQSGGDIGMATLIPSIGTCVLRMTKGERRLAERLEAKLDDDYLLWDDVLMWPRNTHPDFCVLHPRRGILVLEVKDWNCNTILQADKQNWEILGDNGPKTVINPLEQARQYAHQVVNALERDKQLVQADGTHAGKLAFPWSYGVVLTNITRKQFDDGELYRAIEPDRVICKDEILEAVDAEALQSQFCGMFPYGMRGALSRLENHGPMRQRASPTQAAAQSAQKRSGDYKPGADAT